MSRIGLDEAISVVRRQAAGADVASASLPAKAPLAIN
jgi:hypothetical protein